MGQGWGDNKCVTRKSKSSKRGSQGTLHDDIVYTLESLTSSSNLKRKGIQKKRLGKTRTFLGRVRRVKGSMV